MSLTHFLLQLCYVFFECLLRKYGVLMLRWERFVLKDFNICFFPSRSPQSFLCQFFVLFSPRVFQSNVNCQMSFKACASIDKVFSFPSRSSTHSCVKCDFAYVTIFFTGSYLPCTYQKLKMAHTLGGRIWLVCWNFQRCDFFVLMYYMLRIFI